MKFFSLARRLDWLFRDKTRSKDRSRLARLNLEHLEAREVLATAPSIVAVSPFDGSSLPANNLIKVFYSEDVLGAGTAANYNLVDEEGNPAPGAPAFTVAYTNAGLVDANNPTPFQATLTLDANISAGPYTLFVRGDQIAEAVVDAGTLTALRLSQPGEIAVANSGGQNIGTIRMSGDGTLDAVYNVELLSPAQPSAVLLEDMDGDGVDDLVVAAQADSTIRIFLGLGNGEFNLRPDAEFALPTGASGPTDIISVGFGDLVTVNTATGNISYFQNNSIPRSLAFSAGANFAAGPSPRGIVAGFFNNDTTIDLAVANGVVSNGNHVVSILSGAAGGTTFNTRTEIAVGNTATPPVGLFNLGAIAVGDFGGNFLDDLVVTGTNGIKILFSTSVNATPSFVTSTITNLAGSQFNNAPGLSVTAGQIQGGIAPGDDILVTDVFGQVTGYINVGGMIGFQQTASIDSGVDTPEDVTLRGNDVFYVDDTVGLVAKSYQAGAITGATAASPIVITSDGHGLVTGQRVVVSGVMGLAGANGTFNVGTVTGNTFQLLGSTGTGTYMANTGTWVALHGAISNITTTAGQSFVVTSTNHGLETGQQVTFAGVGGSVGGVLNGETFFVTRLSADTFSVNGTNTLAGPFTFTVNTTALFERLPYSTGAGSVSLDLGEFTGDLRDDIAVANFVQETVSVFRGGPNGSFLASAGLTENANFVDVTSADVNNDGIKDLLGVSAGGSLRVLLGNAEGGYPLPQTPTLFTTVTGGLGEGPVALDFGDVDRDGQMDVVVASQSDSVIVFFRGNGDGTFQAPTYTTVGDTPTDIVLGDFDNDNILDVAVSHNGSLAVQRGVTILLGNGDGTFGQSTELAVGTSATSIIKGFFNNDKNIDLAFTDSTTGGRLRVALGDGEGRFAVGTPAYDVLVGPNPNTVISADLNLDGFADLISVSNFNGFGGTPNDIAVSISAAGTGFNRPFFTSLAGGDPLHSVATAYVNNDFFLDLIVTSSDLVANNVQVLFGLGDGSFVKDTDPYTGEGGDFLTPSVPHVVSDPRVRVATIVKETTRVTTNVIANGNFEKRELNLEQGNLDGWRTFALSNSTGGWSPQVENTTPLSETRLPTAAIPTGTYQAVLDQHDLFLIADSDFAGSHALYQDVFIPTGTIQLSLSLRLYLNSFAAIGNNPNAWSDVGINPSLNFEPQSQPNQQVRIDLTPILPDATLLSTAPANLFQNLFTTAALDPAESTQTLNFTLDPAAYAGKNVRLRIASANNRGQLIVAVDNVRFQATYIDTTKPDSQGLQLRNPSFLSGPVVLEQSSDGTIVGKAFDESGVLGIKFVIFDVKNDGFGGLDDRVVNVFDAYGNFSFNPGNLPAGVNTIPVRVLDDAGNVKDTVFTFIVQGPSIRTWQPVGPGPIDTSAQGVEYRTISGKITGIALDPTDTLGATIYAATGNGGVWKSINGGADWTATTDNVLNAQGQPVHIAAGAVAIGSDGVVYAATGVEDPNVTSRPGIGVLKSTDGGRNWTITGATIFAGARVSKMAVHPQNSNIVYVAVASFDTPGKKPGVYKTINGGVTWTDVLLQQNMTDSAGVVLPANTPLASVTDLLIDRFDPDIILIGMGNIGRAPNSTTAGLWLSGDGGATWQKKIGNDSPVIPNNDLPEGSTVGRVTIAQNTGRISDEDIIYVMIFNPPPPGTFEENPYTQGSHQGLYKSKDGLLNFTKVMLREETPIGSDSFRDIDLSGNEGSGVGVLLVDPMNPNVVYVGGSARFPTNALSRRHGLIRVDTGNILDTDSLSNNGDDIDKAFAAALAGNQYPSGRPYTGEGAYWYDLVQDVSGISDFTIFEDTDRLPDSILSMAFDRQGRLLFGTVNGLYRGIARGFGYDFTSGGTGILGNGSLFVVPGMDIFELNGNLQIADLNGVTQDPVVRGRFHISGSDVGTGLTPGGPNAWFSSGLNFLQAPTGYQVIAAPVVDPTRPAILYRVWQDVGIDPGLVQQLNVPERSDDGGETWNAVSSSGISFAHAAGRAPVLAVRQSPIFTGVVATDELLLGLDRVYRSQTSGNAWLPNPSPVLSPGSFISALAIAPSSNPSAPVYYAGTEDGKIFYDDIVVNWVQRSIPNLPAGSKIASLTVDGANPNIVYATITGGSGPRVFRSNNAGQTWTSIAGTGLPQVNAYALAFDPRIATGAPSGLLYVGTETGVFVSSNFQNPNGSTNAGATWTRLGQGLPTVPVVNIQLNIGFETLTVATQGRGAFIVSTDRIGPFIVSSVPTSPTDQPISTLTVTFDQPVNPATFTLGPNVALRTQVTQSISNSQEYFNKRAGELYQTYLRRAIDQPSIAGAAATLGASALGDYNLAIQLIASQEYFNFAQANQLIGPPNQRFIEQAYLDLYGRSAVGDPTAAMFVMQLNGGIDRVSITNELILNTNGSEYRRNLSAGLLNRILGTNYVRPAPTNVPQIEALVTKLNQGTPVQNIMAELLASEEGYREFGRTLGVPAGAKLTSLAFGNFSGAKDAVANFIPDLAIGLTFEATGADKVHIYKGRSGGGYSTTPSLILDLPMGANPTGLAVGDFNGDGMDDLAVSNGGLDGAATGNSVSVFLNNRAVVGTISFAPRVDLNGGTRPRDVQVANIDGASGVDLITFNGDLVANEYRLNVRLGNGAGGFGAITSFKIGDDTPDASEIVLPNAMAIGNVVASAGIDNGLPDLVFSGKNGVIVVRNNSTAGTPAFALLTNRISNAESRSVAIGNLDAFRTGTVTAGATMGVGTVRITSLAHLVRTGRVELRGVGIVPDGTYLVTATAANTFDIAFTGVAGTFTPGGTYVYSTNDIVASVDTNGGQVSVFQNDGLGTFSPPTSFLVGNLPRSIQLVDHNKDGLTDIVVANAIKDGSVSLLTNTTERGIAGETITFRPKLTYATEGDTPNLIRLADTNQDLLTDLAVANSKSEYATLMTASGLGFLTAPSDNVWLDFVYRDVLGRRIDEGGRQNWLTVLAEQFVVLKGPNAAFSSAPNGSYSPIAITPTDDTFLTYTLTFGPVRFDGPYSLSIGPSAQGTLKDFTDLDGLFTNIGNAMNQDRDLVNGEVPNDRFTGTQGIRLGDSGRFLRQLFLDLLGPTSAGRAPDFGGFYAFLDIIEPARLGVLAGQASELAGSAEARVGDIKDAYQRYLRRDAEAAQLDGSPGGWRFLFENGLASQLDMPVNLVGSLEYYVFVTGTTTINAANNALFINQAYLDILGRPVEMGNGYLALLNGGMITRDQIVRELLNSDEGLSFYISRYYQRILGRNPNTLVDETRGWRDFLRTNFPAAGQLTPVERLVAGMVNSPEFSILTNHGNENWVVEAYKRVLRRPIVDPNATDVKARISNILNGYQPQREQVLSAMANNLEFRNRKYFEIFTTFIKDVNGDGVPPTSADAANAEFIYQNGDPRYAGGVKFSLEVVQASILAKAVYYPLNGPGSSNSGYVTKIYFDLLNRGIATDANAQAQITFLNGFTSVADLEARRAKVVRDVLVSVEYRQRFVALQLNRFLARGYAVPPGSGNPEVNYYVGRLNAGARDEDILVEMLRGVDYFNRVAL